MPAPQAILELVQRFQDNQAAYKSPKYNEATLRMEFLNPFFEALGWDIYNKNNYAEAYKDVVIEAAVEVEGAAKAPDYAFRIGGTQKFFVEAKKPSVNIEHDTHPAFQVRRYAWSAGLPLSILTDFEEFAVYDCRSKPSKSDPAATGRVMLVNYRDYAEKWDEIVSRFSREAVLKGGFDQFAGGVKGKRGTQEVDDAFLVEIESWREKLARNLALRNPSLSVPELNYAVQMTIDRIIFLRICEDRGIERENQLKEAVEAPGAYEALTTLFRQADARYNSGLFHFAKEKDQSSQPDDLTLGLRIDDGVLKEIIAGMYYPAPYVFREIPTAILGSVYERFLGKVIRLTPAHQAKVEEKPEVRKAGGVYYTPAYIVDYIVKNTVGKLVEGKTPAEVEKLKIVDPACGSGSFLLGAYQCLLDWHSTYYAEHEPEKWARGARPAIFQGAGGGWRLTTSEKKRILLNNIHGVDIDPQAVEVTKLSLSLKVLEGENQESIGAQLSFLKERALPDLGRNIQCGNSLIGPDYFEGRLFPEEEELRRVNPFDWHTAFPQVFAQGGFDAVIGNPPYIRIQAIREWAPTEADFYKKKYFSASKGNYDIYVVFVEKGLELLNPKGKLGFILPHKFFIANYGEPLRQLITKRKHLSQVVHFGDNQIFEDATTYTCLLFLNKYESSKIYFIKIRKIDQLTTTIGRTISNNRIGSEKWDFSEEVMSKIPTYKLEEFSEKIFQGLATSADPIYVLNYIGEEGLNDLLVSKSLNDREIRIETGLMHPILKGSEIIRYRKPNYKFKVLFPYHISNGKSIPYTEKELKTNFPNAFEYLLENKTSLLKRSKTTQDNWWLFPYPKNLTLYNKPKIISQVLSSKGSFVLDNEGEFHFLGGGNAGGNGIICFEDNTDDLKFLLGILNSTICSSHVRRVGSSFRGGFYSFSKSSLASLPIPTLSNMESQKLKAAIIKFVEKMLDINMESPNTPQEKDFLKREIETTDRQINKLVYALYGLTEEEIKIVEGC